MGTLYNSQLFIDDQGNIMGVHRKLVPTLTEKLVFGRGDGSNLHVFKTRWGEIGGLICGEHANSLAKFSLIARGEKIHIASWMKPTLRPWPPPLLMPWPSLPLI